MTLAYAAGGVLGEKSDYRVKLFNRLRELIWWEDDPDETMLGSDTYLHYEWRGGYEILEHHQAGSGKSDYRGAYHPLGHCECGHGNGCGCNGPEGGYVCIRCGATVF